MLHTHMENVVQQKEENPGTCFQTDELEDMMLSEVSHSPKDRCHLL